MSVTSSVLPGLLAVTVARLITLPVLALIVRYLEAERSPIPASKVTDDPALVTQK